MKPREIRGKTSSRYGIVETIDGELGYVDKIYNYKDKKYESIHDFDEKNFATDNVTDLFHSHVLVFPRDSKETEDRFGVECRYILDPNEYITDKSDREYFIDVLGRSYSMYTFYLKLVKNRINESDDNDKYDIYNFPLMPKNFMKTLAIRAYRSIDLLKEMDWKRWMDICIEVENTTNISGLSENDKIELAKDFAREQIKILDASEKKTKGKKNGTKKTKK